MSDDDTDDNIDPDDLFDIDFEERREKNIEKVTFEECEKIRQAGKVFREVGTATPIDAIDAVRDELGIDDYTAQYLLTLYTCIHTELEEDVSGRAGTIGREFYNNTSIEELSETEDRSPEEIRNDIRAFVGSFIRSENLDEVELDQSVPTNPFQPYGEIFEEMSFNIPDFKPNLAISDEYLTDLASLPTFAEIVDVQPLLDAIDPMTEFQKSLDQVFQVFNNEGFGVSEEAFADIAAIAETSSATWEEQEMVSEFDKLGSGEAVQEPEEREKFEDEGSEAVASVGNVDRDTACVIYNRWWHTVQTAVAEKGARISDGHLAVIAAVAAILMLYTGMIGAGLVFVFRVLVHLSNIGDN